MARLVARAAAVALLGIGAGASLAPSALAQGGESPSPTLDAEPGATTFEGPRDQIVLSGAVQVRRGDEVGEIVVLHGTADVAGIARGDVIVLDGRILVTGQVSGSVVSIDGAVTLGPNAHVLGSVIARDEIRIAGGAVVEGDVREGTAFVLRTPADLFGAYATWFAVSVSTLLLGVALVGFAGRASEAVADATATAPWAAAGLGLALAAGIPILAVLAAVSLVGLPLGLSVLLAFWFVLSLGFAWTVFAIGRLLWRAPRSRWLALLFGWLVVSAVSAIPYAGGAAWFVGAVLGLGSAVVALHRARDPRERRAVAMGGRHRTGGRMLEPDAPAVVPGEPRLQQETKR